MARSATCPACEDRVPVPSGTRPNTRVRCLSCDQAFVPPWLRVEVVEADEEPYDPETAETYTVKRVAGKKVRAKVKAKSQVEEDDENWKPGQQDGPAMRVLLGLGIGLGVVIPAAYLIGKWAVTNNVGLIECLIGIVVILLGLLVVGMALGLFANRLRNTLNRLFGPW